MCAEAKGHNLADELTAAWRSIAQSQPQIDHTFHRNYEFKFDEMDFK